MKCTSCGAELPEGSGVCFECGAPQQTPATEPAQNQPEQANPTPTNQPQKVKCTNCGAELPEGSTVCFECGAPQNVAKPNNNATVNPQPTAAKGSPKSKALAGLLAILFGAWGIDRFYLGDTKKGLIRIGVSVVTCTYGGLIWGIIDGIKILTGKETVDFDGNPIV